MIDDKVDDHTNPAFVAGFHQILKILQCAIIRVHRLVIGHIIAMIRGRRKDRHQPNPADPKVSVGVGITIIEIVELFNDSAEVTNAIPIAILKRADKDFIKNHAVPPSLAGLSLWSVFYSDVFSRSSSRLGGYFSRFGQSGLGFACSQDQAGNKQKNYWQDTLFHSFSRKVSISWEHYLQQIA